MGRLYTRVEAHFNANWEAGVIAKPTFFDMLERDFHPPNSIGILEAEGVNLSYAAPDREEYGRNWDFQLHLFAETYANRELMIEQSIERVNDYESTNQTWYISGPVTLEIRKGLKMAIISCKEDSIIDGGAAVSW